MEEQNWLAQQFEDNRLRLKKVAFRMLGSTDEADDAVQETWLRLSRSDASIIDNLVAWLTTVVARICLDMLRARTARREELLDIDGPSRIADSSATDPEREALLADSIGPALLVVLDMLSPPERVAFVLHDMFGMPFEEIATIVGRTPAAARQLASRARRRIQGSGTTAAADEAPSPDRPNGQGYQVLTPKSAAARPRNVQNDGSVRSERRIVDAFLAAAREGNFQALLAVLDPECVLRADEYAALLGAPRQVKGNESVAGFFNGRAAEASRATIQGAAAAAWTPDGSVRVAFSFSFRNDRIAEIELIADRKRLDQLDIVLLKG